ncbi:putative transport protein [Advenella incenata]|uniref:Putative transport protein n=2 Tax=Advenella incenata TaxID=267800 RepID=A0A4Q7VPA6_9BURK|nr:putative transport protein [Advenella incenata]
MQIYKHDNGNLKEIKEKPFKLEREIQQMFESNLMKIMDLNLVRSEFSIKNKRIDTLGFDDQTKAFVIIEYKRNRNVSVIDQGFTYLSLMLENKADFIVEYNEQLKKNLKRNDVDWSQTRVAFVSPSFTENQVQATNFKDIAIELWEIRQYENGLISINQLKQSKSAASIKPIAQQNNELKKVTDEIKIYTEEDHASRGGEVTFELYEKFRDAILNLGDGIEIKPQKHYIAFKKDSNIACLELQKKKLKIYIGAKAGSLDDSKALAKDVSTIGHWGTGDYEITVDDDTNLEYIMSLIRQVL